MSRESLGLSTIFEDFNEDKDDIGKSMDFNAPKIQMTQGMRDILDRRRKRCIELELIASEAVMKASSLEKLNESLKSELARSKNSIDNVLMMKNQLFDAQRSVIKVLSSGKNASFDDVKSIVQILNIPTGLDLVMSYMSSISSEKKGNRSAILSSSTQTFGDIPLLAALDRIEQSRSVGTQTSAIMMNTSMISSNPEITIATSFATLSNTTNREVINCTHESEKQWQQFVVTPNNSLSNVLFSPTKPNMMDLKTTNSLMNENESMTIPCYQRDSDVMDCAESRMHRINSIKDEKNGRFEDEKSRGCYRLGESAFTDTADYPPKREEIQDDSSDSEDCIYMKNKLNRQNQKMKKENASSQASLLETKYSSGRSPNIPRSIPRMRIDEKDFNGRVAIPTSALNIEDKFQTQNNPLGRINLHDPDPDCESSKLVKHQNLKPVPAELLLLSKKDILQIKSEITQFKQHYEDHFKDNNTSHANINNRENISQHQQSSNKNSILSLPPKCPSSSVPDGPTLRRPITSNFTIHNKQHNSNSQLPHADIKPFTYSLDTTSHDMISNNSLKSSHFDNSAKSHNYNEGQKELQPSSLPPTSRIFSTKDLQAVKQETATLLSSFKNIDPKNDDYKQRVSSGYNLYGYMQDKTLTEEASSTSLIRNANSNNSNNIMDTNQNSSLPFPSFPLSHTQMDNNNYKSFSPPERRAKTVCEVDAPFDRISSSLCVSATSRRTLPSTLPLMHEETASPGVEIEGGEEELIHNPHANYLSKKMNTPFINKSRSSYSTMSTSAFGSRINNTHSSPNQPIKQCGIDEGDDILIPASSRLSSPERYKNKSYYDNNNILNQKDLYNNNNNHQVDRETNQELQWPSSSLYGKWVRSNNNSSSSNAVVKDVDQLYLRENFDSKIGSKVGGAHLRVLPVAIYQH